MENTVIIMCLWLVSGISTGLIATVKGRSPILWFLFGAVGGRHCHSCPCFIEKRWWGIAARTGISAAQGVHHEYFRVAVRLLADQCGTLCVDGGE